jgi:hypothetical protein
LTPLVVDSVTDLDDTAEGRVVACGSHGGAYPGALAAYRRVHGIVFNDAGVGLDEAGIAGLSQLATWGIPAAAVSHELARIGYGEDSAIAPVLHVNRPASDLGCRPGDGAGAVLERMCMAPRRHLVVFPPKPNEMRTLVQRQPLSVWAMDSASLVSPQDSGTVIVTGSHGGSPGGMPDRALKADAAGAVFNHAGGGRDGAGWSRLPALDRRGIPAVTVSEASARIGDGLSSYRTGRVTLANRCARRLGARAGMTTREFIERLVAASKAG